jgi:hypothetical protein
MRDELQERPAQPKMELDDAIHVTRTFLIGLRHPTGFSLSNQASGWQSGHPSDHREKDQFSSNHFAALNDRKRKKVVPASSHQPSCQTSASDFEYGTTAFQSNLHHRWWVEPSLFDRCHRIQEALRWRTLATEPILERFCSFRPQSCAQDSTRRRRNHYDTLLMKAGLGLSIAGRSNIVLSSSRIIPDDHDMVIIRSGRADRLTQGLGQ